MTPGWGPVIWELLETRLAGHHEGVGQALTLQQSLWTEIPLLDLLLSICQCCDKLGMDLLALFLLHREESV